MQPSSPEARRGRYRLPKSRLLTRSRDYGRVFDAKQVFADGELVLYAAANGGLPTRLGTAIGRKVGGAVRRNRIKRLIREAFRLNQGRFPDGLDVVVVTRKGARLTLETIAASLLSLVDRAAAACLDVGARQPRGEDHS